VFLNAGPVAGQVLGLGRLPLLKSWQMYRSFGADICVVRFEEETAGGQRRTLDRFEALRTSRQEAPRYITFIPSEAQVARTGATMCRRLPPPTRSIYASGRCGSRHWWRPLRRLADLDLCTLSEPDLEILDAGGRP
jgi:hypothetical protein